MKTQAAIDHAGGAKALADLLSITPSAISQWGDDVPLARQIQLEGLTGGALKAEPDAMARLLERALEPKGKAAV